MILTGIEFTGRGTFLVEQTFPSEMNTRWIDGEADNKSLQNYPGRGSGGRATDISFKL